MDSLIPQADQIIAEHNQYQEGETYPEWLEKQVGDATLSEIPTSAQNMMMRPIYANQRIDAMIETEAATGGNEYFGAYAEANRALIAEIFTFTPINADEEELWLGGVNGKLNSIVFGK